MNKDEAAASVFASFVFGDDYDTYEQLKPHLLGYPELQTVSPEAMRFSVCILGAGIALLAINGLIAAERRPTVAGLLFDQLTSRYGPINACRAIGF